MDLLEKYGFSFDAENAARQIEAIGANLETLTNTEALLKCFSCMDLTTLNVTDTPQSVERLVDKVNALAEEYPAYPLPASICVYPNFAATVAARRADPALGVTTVAGCFPSSQSYLEVKVRECGADFIKTSTGKIEVNATPMAAWIMCSAIAAYHAATGRKVGFKAAGGVSTARDAMCYYLIASTILGQEWMDKQYFRLGVSRLGNSLMSAIEQDPPSHL